MAKKIVTASLVVSFDSTEAQGGSYLKLELDETRNGEGASFGVGDDVFIRLIQSSDVDGVTIACTSGSLSRVASGEMVPKEETISLTKTSSADLGYPYASGVITWMGVSGGTPKFADGKSIVTVPNKVLAIGKAAYMTKADIWKLSGAGDVESVLIYAEGVVA